MVLANFMIEPGSVVAWLVVGLIAGRLAGKVMQDPGHEWHLLYAHHFASSSLRA